MWERPCVAKGPQSGPGNSCSELKPSGALRTPFATQGRSHPDRTGLKPCAIPAGAGLPAKRPAQAAPAIHAVN
ncbi:hypothetical protein GEV41_21690 [Pseudomonas putida]|nr:hypothetical protein GEV41_21690 [Pseudomonas putida]